MNDPASRTALQGEMPAQNDATLLRRYAEDRDEAAFAEFVQQHVNLVYSAALRRMGGDAHRAEDVAQNVFTTVARDAAKLAQHPVITAWLYTATRNAATDVVRGEQRRRTREREAHAMNELRCDAAHDAEWEQIRPVLDDAIDELDEGDRAAVLLRFFDGRPFAEIGGLLNLSADAARMRTERALEKLRGLLAERGVTSTAAALGVAMASQANAAAPVGLVGSLSGAALAGASLSVVTVASMGTLMSINKVATIVAVAVLTVATGTAVYELRAERQARTDLASVQREHAELVARVERADRDTKSAEDALASARRAQTATTGATTNAPTDPVETGNAILNANPEIKRQFIAERRANVAGRYYPLYRRLGLDEQRIAQFEQIQMAGLSATFSNYPGVGTVIFEAAPALPPAEKSRQLRELLGSDGYQQFTDYEASLSGYVNRLAGTLYFTDTPLTPEQAWQMARVFADVQPKVVRGQTTPAEYWDMVAGSARTFLSEPQMAALAGLRSRDEFSWTRDQVLLRPAKSP